MLKFLLIILLVAIYVVVGRWCVLLHTGCKTVREHVLSVLRYQIELKMAILNKYGKKGIHAYMALCTIVIVILAPVATIYGAIVRALKSRQ